MEKHITDKTTGISYTLVGDFYLPWGELPDEVEERRPIEIWGQRHLRFIKQHRKAPYTELQITGKLNDYLADIDDEAHEMLAMLVKQMAEAEGVTEQLKAENQMEWVGRMNNIRARAEEVVRNDLICV